MPELTPQQKYAAQLAEYRASIRDHAENVSGKSFDMLTSAELSAAGMPSDNVDARGEYRELLQAKEKHEADVVKSQKMHIAYAAWDAAGNPADAVQILGGIVVGLRIQTPENT